MAYPVLAASNTWWSPTASTFKRSNITEIEIVDSYTPDETVTLVDSWDASAEKNGSITCYVIGTKLIIAGNGSGKIMVNEDGSYLFSDTFTTQDWFIAVSSIRGIDVLDTQRTITLAYCFLQVEKVTRIDISSWNTSSCEDFSSLFSYMSNVTSIICGNVDTSKAKSVGAMFAGCIKLTSIDLSWLNTENVTNMNGMFAQCSSLKTLDLSTLNTSKVTSMNYMFREDSNLESVTFGNFDTSNVEKMSLMFDGCTKIKNIDVSNWDVSSCTDMSSMFYRCSSLGELDLSGWDVSKNQFFSGMFGYSPNLKRIKGLDKWNTSAGIGFDKMFENCSKLEEVDLSSFDTTKANNKAYLSSSYVYTATMKNMFRSCNNLKKVTVGPNFSINGDGTNTTAANKATLPTPSSTYIPGADGNWYTFNGDAYAPTAMKDKTAETYYASYNMVADMDVIIKNGSLIDAAKAIREKKGGTDHYTPAQFGAAIRSI